jgi:hypothetical protein
VRANHRARPRHAGGAQLRGGIAVALHVRAAPALHQRRHPRGRIVVEHHYRHLGDPQLLDRAQADALQTAHDHVARPALVALVLG